MKVYVINLPEAVDRKESIIKEMCKTSLDYEFVTPEVSLDINEPRPDWTKGANSLRLTTIKLVEKAIADNEDMIWIWEDDAIIDEFYYSKLEKQIIDFPSFDFIMLNYDYGSKLSHIKRGVLRKTLTGVYRCTSYIINRGIYEEYLKELKVLRPIDASTKKIQKRRKNSFIVEPKPVHQEVGKYSYIRDKIVNY
tara:strand:+ start:3203 stop:3784 length:582 start_codon:yes stop_codon:yes gene_type:complete